MKKILGVLTQNFSLYYDLVEALNRKGIPFVSCSFNEAIPSDVGVIITSRQEASKIDFGKVIKAEDFLSVDRSVESALQLVSKEESKELLVGIDPGDTLGVAIFSGSTLLEKIALPFSEKNIAELKEIINNYMPQKTLIKIGNGASYQRNFLVRRLRQPSWSIVLVDETNTSTPGLRREKDKDAALLIALKQGKPIEDYLSSKPTAGELQFIQKKSRVKSKNSITISKNLAERVSSGEISLEEAIKRQERQDKSIFRDSC
ncbi:MAG TPA: pre-16S rRNA-processing nuclease YqgF [Thermoplasmata archaeon]|nr:pre-16S rRNA-processing nuclease YqgF [Thermoplasmata archaeon]